MPHRLSPSDLDEILALQLTVAWFGESAGNPARLGWWSSDLVDPEGGGDLFKRLVPNTSAWASLALVRACARRVDDAARRPIDTNERFVTLFHFGFAVDEQLDDRLAFHRQQRHAPSEALGDLLLVGRATTHAQIAETLGALAQPRVEIVPGGRKVSVGTDAPRERARALAAALVPLDARYPLPYIEPSA